MGRSKFFNDAQLVDLQKQGFVKQSGNLSELPLRWLQSLYNDACEWYRETGSAGSLKAIKRYGDELNSRGEEADK